MKIKSFKDLKIWQLANELFDMIYQDVLKFPKNDIAKIITNQIVRSISSIGANIAEKDTPHFYANDR